MKFVSLLVCCLLSSACWALKYNGSTLLECNDFVRSQCGTTSKKNLKEVSGLACSRTTTGYLWAVWDEGCTQIKAISPSGALATTLTLSGAGDRDDWEDIATGMVDSANYLFIGAFGDNDLVHAGDYEIHYFPEPAISGKSGSVSVSTIQCAFPDGKAHNVETLLFDPIEQRLYVVEKVKDEAAGVYYLPFDTDCSGSHTFVSCNLRLGRDGEKFDYVTGGDISPDGHWVIIKNKKYALLWERQGSESLTATLARAPQLISAYEEEEQGESVAWLDNSTFYTTSDSKSDTPIYCYTRPVSTDFERVATDSPVCRKVLLNGQLLIFDGERYYTVCGIPVNL